MDAWPHIAVYGARAVVTPSGDLDLFATPTLLSTVGRLGGEGVRHVVLDLDQVDFLDAGALGALVRLRRELAALGGTLTLVCHTPRWLRLMQLTGLRQTFAFVDSRHEAYA